MTSNKYICICTACSAEMRWMFESRAFEYFRCPVCQHVTTLPFPEESQIIQHYNRGFKEGNYNAARRHKDVYLSAMRKMVEVVKEYLYLQGKDIRGASILDIGCFTGEFIYLMSHEGADVFGIELQDEAVEIANERLPGKILKANIMNNDIILPRNQFDIITLLGIIEHVIDPVCLLKKAAELVKPGGLLMIQTPDSASFLARTMGRYWPPYTPIEHIHIFSRRSVSMVLKNLGCKDITIKRHTKKLSLSYVYSMLKVFGPEIYRFVRPFYKIMPDVMTNVRLPFYAGEVILLARF